MSFTSKIKNELAQINIKSKCCKQAFLAGMLYGSPAVTKDSAILTFSDINEETILAIVKIIQSVTKKSPHIINGEKRVKIILETSNQISTKFDCSLCIISFLKGFFIVGAKVNSPTSASYHAELTLHDADKAKLIYDLLQQKNLPPKIINRKNAIGLYYKSSVAIEELLVMLGATTSAFDLMNGKIARTIRNEENRATNCVARNISKTVSASNKQIKDINMLIKSGQFEVLPHDLRITAKLRLENPEASLSELARLHKPIISKSGLNHRLRKIDEEVKKMNQ